jgi:hypothetical protein
VRAFIELSALNIGLSFFFQGTAKETSSYDAAKLKEEIPENINGRHLCSRIQELNAHKPGLTLLTLLLTLNQG